MTGIVDISWFQLALCLLFVLVAGAASVFYKLGLGRSLVVGSIRCYAQLFLMGYVLKFVFSSNISALTIGVFLVMVVAAAQVIHSHVKKSAQIPFIMPVFWSMLLTYSVTSFLVVYFIVGADPWWKPQYFLPLSGMIVGNSMTAISIALERLFSDLKKRKGEVEMQLLLGATSREASQHIFVDALKAGMIPSINSLMGVGLVFMPGMMTGQILSGADPVLAVRYQIIVMLMIVGTTCIGSLLALNVARRRCFSANHAFILR